LLPELVFEELILPRRYLVGMDVKLSANDARHDGIGREPDARSPFTSRGIEHVGVRGRDPQAADCERELFGHPSDPRLDHFRQGYGQIGGKMMGEVECKNPGAAAGVGTKRVNRSAAQGAAWSSAAGRAYFSRT
jgi:hypothetical protein